MSPVKNIQTVFIANRGEIAFRIAQTVQKMGMRAVGVYLEQEKQAPYVQLLDQATRLEGFSLQSFLDIDALIAHAKSMKADAVHPGYGFLSENPEFAKRCAQNDLIWIGPSSEVIEKLGDKQHAKSIAQDCNVPVLKSIAEKKENDTAFEKSAASMTMPLLIKPMMGGGGKGMTVIRDAKELAEALPQARSTAKNAFGDSRLLAEPYLSKPRHIEVQMLRDHHGQTSFLWERDCTVQRRHQKIIEEAPSMFLTEQARSTIATYATNMLDHVGYTNAGTVEFIVDENHQIYFMEVNTRLQVEHPVTEELLGIDIVEAQINIAQHKKVKITPKPSGHALEVRIYAENPDQDFMPSTGMVQYLHMPSDIPTLRLDMGVQEGTAVTSFFDPMLMKITVCGKDRTQAIARMQEALGQMKMAGVQTNQTYIHWVLNHDDFIQGRHHTQWTQATMQAFHQYRQSTLQKVIPLWEKDFTTRYQTTTRGPWQSATTPDSTHPTLWEFQNEPLLPTVPTEQSSEALEVFHRQGQDWLFMGANVFVFQKKKHQSLQAQNQRGVISPMTGTITEVHVQAGDDVIKDQVLVEMEAMKMQYKLRASEAGKVSQVNCQPLQVVQGDTLLVDVEPA